MSTGRCVSSLRQEMTGLHQFIPMMELSFNSIDVERRGYGRRYSCLPVDAIDHEGFTIDCSESYMRPELFDLQPGDTVRWAVNGQRLQGHIDRIERNGVVLRAVLRDVDLLPPDFFAP